ncbi:OmpA family protein [Chitinophaga silvisoli]|uniref:OmpA-like domain-containing protein n=1 Tax=Chitinophaga silvisoli TaxID=2291814 RepID=A0A3E1P8N0_9BACT|nr:OmpA family protein [Chitinophaga silvisoli]RFM36549.1 hypothetical protein DXN04_03350 [Chitinophaga silvisoli]
MLRCYAILLCTLLVVPAALFGQESKSVRELADEAYDRQEFATAGSLYSKLANKQRNKSNVELLQKISMCYREVGYYEEAANWFKKLDALPNCPNVAHLLYGETLKNLQKYEQAKVQIAKFVTTKPDSLRLKNIMMAGCDSAIMWKADRVDMAMEDIKELSSSGSDYVSGVTRQGLLLVSNGYRKMAISNAPEKTPQIDTRTGQPYFKAYLFKQYAQGVANTYVEEILPELLGKVPYHVGPVCFNPREDTVYVTLNSWQQDIANKTKRGPVNGERVMIVFWSYKTGDTWAPLEPLKEINAPGFSSGHVALSRDGQLMYFTSDRKGSVGGMDIWYSEKQKNGKWGKPKNCGPILNTPFDEAFPTYNEAGMLYFSSKGHPGMGGFDIYRATGVGSNWTKLQNLRWPFNSGGDDLGFIMKANMYEGYFASNRPGGGGSDDIYRFMDTHFAERFNNEGGMAPYQAPAPGSEPAPVVLAAADPVVKPEDVKTETKKDSKKESKKETPIEDKKKDAPKEEKEKPSKHSRGDKGKSTAVVPVPVPVPVPSTPTPAPTVSTPPAKEEPVVTSPMQPVTVPYTEPTVTHAEPAPAPAEPVKEEPKKTETRKPGPRQSTPKRPVRPEPKATLPEPKPEPVTPVAEPVPTPAPVPTSTPAAEEEQPFTEMDNAIIDKLEKLMFFYDYNSAILTTKSRDMLDRVAVVLNQFPAWKLKITSYTDNRGSDAYNKDLSAMRCYAVIDYLIKKGVASSRLYYENIGKDPNDPCKGSNCTEEQYKFSRRTMLKIIRKN